MAMVRRFGDDAMPEAAARARQFVAHNDMASATTWRRIGEAIERLQTKAPAEGEPVH